MAIGIPAALALLSVVTSVASAGVGIVAGEQQKKASEEAAKMEEDAAQMEAAIKKSQLAAVQSTVRANLAAMGTEATSGSGFALLESNQRKADIDIGLAAKSRSQRAFQLRSEGSAARTKGILSGVTSLGQAASTGAENYGVIKKGFGW